MPLNCFISGVSLSAVVVFIVAIFFDINGKNTKPIYTINAKFLTAFRQ
jgi:hypothetical protein